MHRNATEKLNAVIYDLERLKRVYTDTGGQLNQIDAQQTFLQFCADTYSLHDWLIEESTITKKSWEDFLSKTEALFLIAKIETINKHAATDNKFWQRRYSNIQYNHHAVFEIPGSRTSGHMITKGKYEITADGIAHDALDLAKTAFEELKHFLQANRLNTDAGE